jgi:acetyl-CoA carboxylase carboxyl transferase subunit beta
MDWFKRQKKGIQTSLNDQNEVPEGHWTKCAGCGEIVNQRELDENLMVCPKCDHHLRIGCTDYFKLLFDDGEYTTFDENLHAIDALDFTDRKSYKDRLKDARGKTGLNDAAQAAIGKIGGFETSVAAMDFSFIGGSMGSVVGEIVTRAIRRAYELKIPLIIVSKSGGARMMEGALSLMQMGKTSANLARYNTLNLPYISVLTDPTTGGITASFAMLGDFHFAEPNALIGFAGPRVIRETMGQDLPEGFQTSAFLQERGFVDSVIDRRQLKNRIVSLYELLLESETTD